MAAGGGGAGGGGRRSGGAEAAPVRGRTERDDSAGVSGALAGSSPGVGSLPSVLIAAIPFGRTSPSTRCGRLAFLDKQVLANRGKFLLRRRPALANLHDATAQTAAAQNKGGTRWGRAWIGSIREPKYQYWSAGSRAKGEFRCSGCGYGVTVHKDAARVPDVPGSVLAAGALAAVQPFLRGWIRRALSRRRIPFQGVRADQTSAPGSCRDPARGADRTVRQERASTPAPPSRRRSPTGAIRPRPTSRSAASAAPARPRSRRSVARSSC